MTGLDPDYIPDVVSESEVNIKAILNKITTTVDGGWRLTLDIGNEEQENLLRLADMRDTILKLVIVKES